VPSYATAKREEAKAFDVLAQVLGGGSNSRLYRRLVVDKRLATNAGAAYQGSAVDPTRLSVYATPQPGVALPDIENEIDAVIAEVIADGVAAEELERAKTRLIANATYAQDNSRAWRVGSGSRSAPARRCRMSLLGRIGSERSARLRCTPPQRLGSTDKAVFRHRRSRAVSARA
jgi:hypothetical protein